MRDSLAQVLGGWLRLLRRGESGLLASLIGASFVLTIALVIGQDALGRLVTVRSHVTSTYGYYGSGGAYYSVYGTYGTYYNIWPEHTVTPNPDLGHTPTPVPAATVTPVPPTVEPPVTVLPPVLPTVEVLRPGFDIPPPPVSEFVPPPAQGVERQVAYVPTFFEIGAEIELSYSVEGFTSLLISIPLDMLAGAPMVVDAGSSSAAAITANAPLPAAIPTSGIRAVLSLNLYDNATGEKISILPKPIDIKMSPTADDLAAAGGDPNRLSVMRQDDVTGEFFMLPTRYDPVTGQTSSATDRTSLFALVIIPEEVPTVLDYEIANGRFYAQASGLGGRGGLGFSIADNAGQPAYWTAYQTFGGFERLGYPASRPMVFAGRDVQVTQKAILQQNAELGGFVLGNILDDMHALGLDSKLEANHLVPPVRDLSPDVGLTWDAIMTRHLAFLSEDFEGMAAISTLYHKDGLGHALTHYGLPMSVKDYGAVVVVRAQRAVFHYWKTDTPWSTLGQVVLANVGDIGKALGVFSPTGISAEFPASTGTS